jgi:hypothetical protein
VEKLGEGGLPRNVGDCGCSEKLPIGLYPLRCLKNSTWRRRFSASALVL